MIKFEFGDKTIAVVSREFIEHQDPGVPFVLVSIRDPGTKPVHVNSTYLLDGLFLTFSDVDKCSPIELKNYTPMSEDQARCVVSFILAHNDVDMIICHCEAGVSRSAGMAAAIARGLGYSSYAILNYVHFVPNEYVYNLVSNKFVGKTL